MSRLIPTVCWLMCLMLISVVSGAAEYVGTPVCGTCHSEAEQTWRGSHHDLAMLPASEETVLGDFDDAVFEHNGVRSRFYRRDGHFFVETEGADGQMQEFRAEYTFGADPLQQYLIGFPDGRYQALTVAWDSRPAEAGGQRWFHLYPDETIPPGDRLHWTAPAHNWNFTCAECHSTDLRKNYDPVADRYDTEWAEINVACEACHGPGSEHVSLAEAAAAGDADYPADHGLSVNFQGPGDWRFAAGLKSAFLASPKDAGTEVEACGRCHARRAQLTGDYVHGQPLSDTHRVQLLNEGLYFPDGQIQDEVYVYGSFKQSLMHAKGVTCTDCHEPHSLQLRAQGNALCTRCHQADQFETQAHHFHPLDSDGAQCVSCHMPSRTYMVIDPRRDHSMRIPRPDLSVELGVPNACTGCHENENDLWAAQQVQDWYGRDAGPGHQAYAHTFEGARQGAPGAGQALIELIMDGDAPAIARATALQALPPFMGPAALPAVQAGLASGDPLIRRAAVEALASIGPRPRWQLVSPLFEDPDLSVRLAAAATLSDTPGDQLNPQQRAQLEAALAEYEASEHFNADRVEHWVNLAGLYARLDDMERAEQAYREAARRDIAYPPLYVNWADMLRASGRDDEAGTVLKAGLEQAPADGALHHAYGLWLIRAQRTDEALNQLKQGFELAPSDPRLGYVYGVALNSTGEPEDAIEVWQAVLAQRTYDRDTLYALALALRDQGRAGEAIQYAERLALLLPGEAAVSELVQQLNQAAGG